MRPLSLTPAEADLLGSLLRQTILDTGSNKTAAACKRILGKLAERNSSRATRTASIPPQIGVVHHERT